MYEVLYEHENEDGNKTTMTAIAKIAPFDWDINRIEFETWIYFQLHDQESAVGSWTMKMRSPLSSQNLSPI